MPSARDYRSYLAPLKCKARRIPNVPAREGTAGSVLRLLLVVRTLRRRPVPAAARCVVADEPMTLGERAIVTAILCGMVLVMAFFVVGMLFPELLPWYGRWGRMGR